MPKNNYVFDTPSIFEHYPARIAHRGASGEAPENTFSSIELAIQKYQVDMVEIDVQLTKDGVPVVFHDSTLERTTDGKGAVSEYTLEELKRRDAGFCFDPENQRIFPYRGKGAEIPTLEEVLSRFSDSRFCIEIKEKDLRVVDQTLEVICRRPRKGRLLIGSFHGKIARALRRKAPPFIEGTLSKDETLWIYLAYRFGFRRFTGPSRYAFLPRTHHGTRLDEPDWIHFIHNHGAQVFYWTVNEISEMEILLNRGADGIITDFPDRLNQILKK